MNRSTLIAAIAASVVGVGGVGILLGQTVFDPHGNEAANVESGHGEKEGHAEADGVVMTPEQLAASGIEIVAAKSGAVSGGIEAQGAVAATPDGLAILSARSPGSIAFISKRLGDPVARGEVLARIESGEGATLASNLASARSRERVARSAFEREKQLYDAKVTARQDFETAQQALTSAEAELASAKTAMAAAGVSEDGRYVLVRSPIAGRIIGSRATLGAFVEANAELFRVADPAKVHIETALTADDAARVKPGDKALVILRNATVETIVRSVTPGLDIESRTVTAVLNLDARAAALQPGQVVRVRILTQAGPAPGSAITVPEEAVQSYEGRDVVFVRTDAGFVARPVTVVARAGGNAEIRAGLAPGEQVAGRNAFLVKAELGKSEASHED